MQYCLTGVGEIQVISLRQESLVKNLDYLNTCRYQIIYPENVLIAVHQIHASGKKKKEIPIYIFNGSDISEIQPKEIVLIIFGEYIYAKRRIKRCF